MAIYTPKDKILFDKYNNDIINKSYIVSQDVIGPSLEEIKKIQQIIFKYIKNKNRIIYGGFALNLYLLKFKKELFLYETLFENNYPYTTHNVYDIDCYSPDPRKDMINICELLYDAKIKNVEGKEAQHTETYIVYANYTEFCNFTYMPIIISNMIPKIHFKINGYDVMMLRTDFVSIDYFRIFTDPIGSYRLLIKQFDRFVRLQSTNEYKLGGNEKKMLLNKTNITNIIPQEIYDVIYNIIKNNREIILFGYIAYNIYSTLSKSNNVLYNYPIQFYSTDYKNAVILIYSILKKKFGDKIKIKEYYPFFQYYGHNVAFYYENICIIHMYSNNEKCIPFKETNMIENVISNIKIQNDDFIYIGTFTVNIMMTLILYTYSKIYNNKKAPIFDNMLSDMLQFKIKYLNETKQTIFDNNVFEEFVVNCIGHTIRPDIKKWNLGKKRLQMKKKPVFKYIPSGEKKELNAFIFANCSGNKIKNEKKYTFKDIPHYISNE